MRFPKTRQWPQKALFWLFVLLIAFYFLFPFYWIFNSSLKTDAQWAMAPTTFVPRDPETGAFAPTFDNYTAVLTNISFLRALRNSFIISGSAVLLSLLFGSFAALAIAILRFRGKTAVTFLILSLTMFPQIAVLTGLYAVINTFALPAMPSVIVSYLLFTLPLATWVMIASFREMPLDLLDAARIDGATLFQSFRKILLPLMRPALITSGLLTFIIAFNEYLFALTFTVLEPHTVPVTVNITTLPLGQVFAAAAIIALLLLVLIILTQNYILRGLTASALRE
jgi:trehalose/maltose transport system permease protein